MTSRLLFLTVVSAGPLAGEVIVNSVDLPDIVDEVLLPDEYEEMGFYEPHAPPGKYTPAQISAALAAAGPDGKGYLESRTGRRFVGDEPTSFRTVIDPAGALVGVDYSGNPLDLQTWTSIGPDVTVDVSSQTRRERTSRDFVFREYVKADPPGPGNVDVSVWSTRLPTDVVDTNPQTLRYSPAAVPAFIPSSVVADALSGASPGDVVPLVSGYEVIPLATDIGSVERVVEAFNAQFGVDFIGDPNNYQTWIAITSNTIQVNVLLRQEEGRAFVDQALDYELVVPDATGEVILNPLTHRVVEVTDTTRNWSKTYSPAGVVPPEVTPGNAAVLAGKLGTGEAGMALHVIEDAVGDTEDVEQEDFDDHGAQQGIDYSGDPLDPGTWTALTSDDVVVDSFVEHTVTTERTANHEVRMIYREASDDPGTTGQVFLIENDVVGRDILQTTRSHLNAPLDPGNLPEGVTAEDVRRVLMWGDPGESVVVARLRETLPVSDYTTPLADIVDSNEWEFGVDFTGDPGDPQTWVATGPADVYIDIYHPVTRVRTFEEKVTNLVAIVPAGLPAPLLSEFSVMPSSFGRVMRVSWDPPYGMEFGVDAGSLESLVPGNHLFKSLGERLRFDHHVPAGLDRSFLRVVRR
ncbi:hypothetical protein HAHE_21890 [Haloferula helveola]|uniref:Uncharacterized protein n=1 Tax=Haloferula helveola TaxID=490095 RepID=A0ABM7RMA4_9BACT|nr:hypothetical protein HAHE_21890 [Haloferula helveola]